MRLIFCCILYMVWSTALAHGGGLNAQGCHHNRKTGDYHCHRSSGLKKPSPTTSAKAKSKNKNKSCGSKRYCGQMRSCAEARFYFSQCGVRRLDGDNDGVPCENLCR